MSEAAAKDYAEAINLSKNQVEKRFLFQKRDALAFSLGQKK